MKTVQTRHPFCTAAYFTLLLLCALFMSTNIYAQKAGPLKIKYPEYSIKIISVPGNSYGYEIFRHNSKIISQPNIPGMPGNKGFKSKADAQKVASLAAPYWRRKKFPGADMQLGEVALGICALLQTLNLLVHFCNFLRRHRYASHKPYAAYLPG